MMPSPKSRLPPKPAGAGPPKLLANPGARCWSGASPAIRRTADIIRLVARRRSTVLISGETGTGKEVVARALHMASPRGQFPMIAVNVAALPETLLEAELFGHVKGAFTGASQQRIGRCEQANRSTLFLDEIGDLPLDVQTKLLRFLQEREFQRVGSSETIRVDVRMIVAANVNLLDLVRQGTFREDLYYRLSVIPITVPPLRERPEDIPLLANHFIAKICVQENIPQRRLTPAALAKLRGFAWPGNVRQLENAIETAIALSGDRELLIPSDFTFTGRASAGQPGSIHRRLRKRIEFRADRGPDRAADHRGSAAQSPREQNRRGRNVGFETNHAFRQAPQPGRIRRLVSERILEACDSQFAPFAGDRYSRLLQF